MRTAKAEQTGRMPIKTHVRSAKARIRAFPIPKKPYVVNFILSAQPKTLIRLHEWTGRIVELYFNLLLLFFRFRSLLFSVFFFFIFFFILQESVSR